MSNSLVNYDPWAGFADFLQQFGQMPTPSADQMTTLAAYAPIMGLYQQLQAGGLQQSQYQVELQKMAYDYKLSKEQLRQAELQTQFQEGPYFDYLKAKTANDISISNNDVLSSNNNVLASQAQVETAKQATARAKNDALSSAYQTQQARYGDDAARYNFLVQTGKEVPPDLYAAQRSSGFYGY
jgi:hypothetical protein